MKHTNVRELTNPVEVETPAESQFSLDVSIGGPDFKVRLSANGPSWVIRKLLQDIDKSIGGMS